MPTTSARPSTAMTLQAETAADVMRPNPVSIEQEASVQEAISLLTEKHFSAAPVIDEAGRPVGVISRSDIIVHDRCKVDYAAPVPHFFREEELQTAPRELRHGGFQVVDVDRTTVADIMTPVVFSVTPETPIRRVVQEMLGLSVHRLFVVDADGVLVGVISASDVLRQLR